MPTTFTVITSSTASFREFHRKEGMLPARKNRITARGSVFPAASFSDQVFNSVEIANIDILKRYEYSINPNGYQLY